MIADMLGACWRPRRATVTCEYLASVAVLVLIVAVVAVSTSAPLVRAAEPTPALAFAALRVLAAAAVLGLIAGPQMRLVLGLPARERWLVLAAGLLLGCHFGVWITSLYFTSTAASVSLVATQPIFAVVLGRVFLGDRASPRAIAGIAVAAAGCALLAGGDWAQSSDAVLGDALAVAGAATAAGYLILGRSMRAAVPLVPYLAAVNAIAGLALLVVALVVGVPLDGHGSGAYLAIGACALLGSVLGHTLLNWSVRRIPAHLVTLAILGEPVGASVLTFSFFGERPPVHALAGGAVILVGIAVAFLRTDKMRAQQTKSSPD